MISPEVAHHIEYGVELGLLAFAFSKTIREEVIRRQYGLCDMCKLPARLQVHHRVPHCQKGEDTIDNAVGLCEACHKTVDYEALHAGIIYPQRHYSDEDE